MRMPRMKVPVGTDGVYHCYSHVVDDQYIFGRREKDKFLHMMWRIADFLGVQVLNYTLMSNHYHQMVFVPGKIELTNQQLLARLKAYYGETSSKYREFLEAVEKGDQSPELLKPQYLRRMGNISEFEKTLKQGFSTWYNQRKERKGTLWMERFGSTIAEDTPQAAIPMAAYIDLNPVRAGIVDDPKDYLYCSYAAALGGDQRCQQGLLRIMQMDCWTKASRQYRIYLMQQGQMERPGKRGKVSRETFLKALQQQGELPVSQLLRLRVRYFTHGLVLGSEEFVEKQFQQYRSHFGERRKTGARPIRGLAGSGLYVIRDLRKSVFS